MSSVTGSLSMATTSSPPREAVAGAVVAWAAGLAAAAGAEVAAGAVAAAGAAGLAASVGLAAGASDGLVAGCAGAHASARAAVNTIAPVRAYVRHRNCRRLTKRCPLVADISGPPRRMAKL